MYVNISFWYSHLNYRPSQLEKTCSTLLFFEITWQIYRIFIFSLELSTITTWKNMFHFVILWNKWQISHFDIYSPLNHRPSQLEKHVLFCYSVKLCDKYRILIFSQWRNRRAAGGRVPPWHFSPGNFCWPTRKKRGKEEREKRENGEEKKEHLKGKGKRWKIENKGENGWKWIEDFFLFFWLYSFWNHWNLFGVY